MLRLLIVSLIWAFSFGLIKGPLHGIDPAVIGTVRLAGALLLFLPALRLKSLPLAAILKLASIGAIQFGVMYLLYLRSYHYLKAYEVALFTLTTPLFIAVLDAVWERRLALRHFLAAVLSILGAAAIVWHAPPDSGLTVGIVLVQASNLCFAAGQIAWRRLRKTLPEGQTDASLFALLYAGALLVSVAAAASGGTALSLAMSGTAWATLLFLGLVSSGLCFFWWNQGAAQVNAGTLAAFNNAKIPLGVACSLLVFGEHADLVRLTVSAGLLAAAVWVSKPSEGPA